ncbi:MAG: aminopeptidase P family protein [Flavobacteriales bacterium]|nr:aminopeptidase P family protein [Flavobacteriales bacterium]
MKYLPIDSQLFINNRERFCKLLKTNCLAIFNSNDQMPTNADGTMPFRQNNDLFYLSGIDQEETILLIYPGADNEAQTEMLFVKETSKEIAIWEGEKHSKDSATQTSGIKSVHWLANFEEILANLIKECDKVYVNSNEHERAVVRVETRDARFIKKLNKDFAGIKLDSSAPFMHELRAIKSDIEVEMIQKACDITEKGFRRVLGFIKPGVMEYEIEAELTHEFIRNRSRGFAYEPIIASGFNACVLHYLENNKECKDGDLILMDVAAEYGNYASDLTRSIPVSGKYSERQAAVYNAVLRVMKQAVDMLVVGNNLKDYHAAVGKLMEGELIDLGLLKKEDVENQDHEKPLFKKYFMHGTSHHLGLDVHDVADLERTFEAGMVFTCEPGIYIRDENLGIRIENDYLITENGAVDLMANIPIEIEEIEALMAN